MAKDQYSSARYAAEALQFVHFSNSITDAIGGAMEENEAATRFNIEHFRSLLATERNEARLMVLRQLLAEEEQKLAAEVSRWESKLGPEDVEKLNRKFRHALRNLLIATVLSRISSIKKSLTWARRAFANPLTVALAIIRFAVLGGIAITKLPILTGVQADCSDCN